MMDNERHKILFENTSNFSSREIDAFNRVSLKPTFIKLGIILALVLASFGLYMYFESIKWMLFVFIGLSGLSCLIMPFVYKATIKKLTYQNKLISSTTFVEFKFEEGGVRTQTRKGDIEIATFAVDYRMITKIVENDAFLFFFVAQSYCYILDKNGMFEGKIEDLITFLKSKNINWQDKSKKEKVKSK